MQESKSSRLFLISSLILGLVAAVVSFAYLDKATSSDNGPKTLILVAKHDLRENTLIDPERDLEELRIPNLPQFAPLVDRCLRPGIKPTYKGQRVNRHVVAGTPVMLADLLAAADLHIGAGKVALSIPVKGAQGLSGLLVPEDRVKLLVTVPVIKVGSGPGGGTGPTGQWESTKVLDEPLRILAVGSRLARSRAQISVADQYQMGTENDSAQTVTLEVTEDQAKTILEKTGAGALPVTLILCPPEVEK